MDDAGAEQPTLLGAGSCVIFCALSLLSYVAPAGLHLMVAMGLVLPLAWGVVTGAWGPMGFAKARIRSGLLWGLAAGAISSLIGLTVIKDPRPPERPLLELAVGVPMWLLLASPFQEFFFRGWLQSRWQKGLGRELGLVITTAAFTAWHYLWPLAEHSTFPLHSTEGLLATFGAGLVYGYTFQRSGSIVAPWLGHALSGVVFILVGSGSLLTTLRP